MARFGPIKATAAGLLLSAAMLAAVAAFAPGLNTASEETGITVPRGMSFRAIVRELQEAGSIRSAIPLLALGRIVPDWHKVKPGRYRIPPGLSTAELLSFLHEHAQDEVQVTIPEGLSLTAIARILEQKLALDEEGFATVAANRAFLARHGISGESAEGYLFPGTYHFPWASTPEEAAGFLVGRFRHFFTDSLQAKALALGLEENELLTLASIVEAETPLDEEKPLVASVYLNRLRRNMRLQADPTVRYALGEFSRRLYYRDLETDSPYNTYVHHGLPPGPICNPGRAAIEAVLEPAETTYLFFVATGSGGHRFASTLQEHQKNVRAYRNARAAGDAEKRQK